MYRHDPQTFEKVIEPILENYPNKEMNEKGKEVPCNPFLKYKEEHGYIRKYSKKGNGPEIKSLKYYDSKLLGNPIDITPENSKNKVVLQSLKPWRTDVYFNKNTGKYEILGLKYADLQFEKKTGTYKISQEKYNGIMKEEGVDSDSEFKFTLYKNDLLLVKDTETKEQQLFRFLSRTMPNVKYYVELKPYSKDKFEKNESLIEILGSADKSGRCIKGLGKSNISIYKVRTDVLGNQHIIKNEGDKPKLDF